MKRIEDPQLKHKAVADHQSQHLRVLDGLRDDFYYRFTKTPSMNRKVEEFDTVKTIGEGSFGIVFLVRDKNSLRYYAMKCIDKELTVKKKNLKQLLLEKKILQSITCPFVLGMDYFCKDNCYVYFVSQFECGGELYQVMRKLGGLNDELSTFYASQTVLALEFLHYCDVIHRDLKPENIFICVNGYIKLGDLGLGKVIKAKTNTLCGTPEYIAPEVILGKGYNFEVDWWSLGVLIFEMVATYPPFYCTDLMKLYDKILAGTYKSPDDMPAKCKNIVKLLLQVDPKKRLGYEKNVFDIKSHVWFESIDWQEIYKQSRPPPYKPNCKSAGDLTHFPDMPDKKLSKATHCLYEKDFENF